ncbi:MAG: DnaJ domain-containing protein [Planctomycetaceae bacterium]
MLGSRDRHLAIVARYSGIAARPEGVPGGDPAWSEGRPDFMALLGLLPPYIEEDVHKAYKAKAIEWHPDRGGSKENFIRLQEAYENAMDFVKFTEGRRLWLARQVEPYLRQQEVVADVERRGGSVTVETVDWMQRSFGDFASLADRLRGIRLRDNADGDAFLRSLAEAGKDLRYLVDLDLAGTRVSDAGLVLVQNLRNIQRLNLARTGVTAAGLRVLQALGDLQWLNLAGTSIGWWGRQTLKRALSGVQVVATETA